MLDSFLYIIWSVDTSPVSLKPSLSRHAPYLYLNSLSEVLALESENLIKYLSLKLQPQTTNL
jgi:hypothetical protein